MRAALLLTVLLACGASAETPRASSPAAAEAAVKDLGASMSHWALLCPPESADPRLRQFSERLGDLHERLDRRLDAKGLATLKEDFETWKNDLTQALYASHGSGDQAQFRAQLERGVRGVAALSEKSHVTERDIKAARAQMAGLKSAIGAAQADFVFEKAAPKGGAGALAAAKAAGDAGFTRLYANYRPAKTYTAWVGQARVLKPEQAKAPAAPSYPTADLSSAQPADKDLIAYVNAHWGFSTGFAWLVVKTAHMFGVDPRIPLAMMKQESGGKASALSPKGASGLMQLMPATAARLGVTDIWNPAQNVWGGVKYVAYLTKLMASRGYHGLQYILAGYNAGEGAVFSHHGVPAYRETMGYVATITANFAELAGKVPARG